MSKWPTNNDWPRSNWPHTPSRTERLDAIEEQTHDLHQAAAAEVKAELQADYREEFGEAYASSHPYHIAPATFERLVIERMRKNAQPPKKEQA